MQDDETGCQSDFFGHFANQKDILADDAKDCLRMLEGFK